MSSNHKAPLAAFVVVAIACVVVLATNSMRSYARDAWRSFAAPVIGGLHLNGPAHKPAGPGGAKASTVAAVVPDEPAASAASTAAPRGAGKADRPTHGKKVKAKPKHGGDQAVVAVMSTPEPTPATPVQAPTTSQKPGYGWALGTRPSWSHGKQLGWSSHTTSAGTTATSQWSKQAKHPGRNPWGSSALTAKTDRGHGHGLTVSDTRSTSAKGPWASAPGHGSLGNSGSHSWPGGDSSWKGPWHGSSWGSHRR